MVNEKPDIILIFHDNLKNSKGTKHCVKVILEKISVDFNFILLLNGEIIEGKELKGMI